MEEKATSVGTMGESVGALAIGGAAAGAVLALSIAGIGGPVALAGAGALVGALAGYLAKHREAQKQKHPAPTSPPSAVGG